MKRNYTSFKFSGICLLLAAILLQGCDKATESPRDDNNVSFRHFTIERAYTLVNSSTDYETDSDLTIGCRANIFLPEQFLGHDMTAFRDSVLKKAFDSSARSRQPRQYDSKSKQLRRFHGNTGKNSGSDTGIRIVRHHLVLILSAGGPRHVWNFISRILYKSR